ncbi:response regulator [Leisingera daeponensis]|uniref:histidine kinase n=1 Tax=Leisingera daeponensis TaxID=405746 RepID=A0ABS7NLR6_9RHOB|nr:ATP-binding protein [Leisingera daeponensis]MBY6142130.1 response regulator [Leisingera daeponensis]
MIKQLARRTGTFFAGFSLQSSLFLVLVIGLTVPISLLAFHTHNERKETLLNELRQHLSEVTDVLASGLVSSTWNLDAEAARPLLNAVMSDERVVDITVYTELIPRFLQASEPSRRSKVGRPLLMQKAIYRGDEKIAFVVVEMSTARMEAVLEAEEQRILLAAVAQFAVSLLVILFFLQRNVIRPLRSLAMSAQSVAEGVLGSKVDTSGWGEVGRLGSSFDAMRRALKDYFAQVEAQRQELQESEALKRAVIDSTLDCLVTISDTGKIVQFNPAAEKTFAVSKEDAVGEPFQNVIWLDGKMPEATATFDSFMKRFSDGMVGQRKEVDLVSPQRPAFPAEATISSVRTGQENFYVLQLRDISHRKAMQREKDLLERQLAQSQKMEAIGTMAGGIAHDFNNILGIAIGAAEIASDLIPPESSAQKYVARTLEAGTRGRALVKQILSFSSPSSKHRSGVLAVELAGTCIDQFRETAPSATTVEFTNLAGSLAIYADPVQISQVVTNILLNAADAMPDGGQINVILSHCTGGDEAGPTLSSHADLLKLTISDTGCGMDEETAERIFDGFFTTKGTGHGLGLTLAHSIVTSHGGHLCVSSAPGSGSCFSIYLPVYRGALPASPRAEEHTPGAAVRRFRTVMLVDDEQKLIDLTEHSLVRLFAEVETFSDPGAAWQHFKRCPEKYELLMTDYSMPGMTGVQLAAKVRAARPEIPVIIYSGMKTPEVHDQARKLKIDAVLTKPFFRGELIETVQRICRHKARAR